MKNGSKVHRERIYQDCVEYLYRVHARRDEYRIEQLAGGTKGRFAISGHKCQREDFTLVRTAHSRSEPFSFAKLWRAGHQ
jgi:hypothetical protein